MLITAQNHTPNLTNADKLCFSNGCYIWGWASWRRAWDKMDMNMSQWSQYKFKDLVKSFGFIYACFMLYYWNREYKNLSTNASWATRWFFSVLVNQGLCLSSNVCLSVNTGITTGGAHYKKGDINPYDHIPLGRIKWPVQIPDTIEVTKEKNQAERKEFIRIRKIGMRKILRKYMQKIKNKL
jgi:hypothetical protein